MAERIVKFIVKKPDISTTSLGIQNEGSFDGRSVAPVDIDVLSDSVLHMARAIISDAMSLEDREIKIQNNETKISCRTKKVEVGKVDSGKVKKDELALGKLGEMLEKKSFEEKASFAELLSEEVKYEYEGIKSDKNVRDCVSDIKTALKVYKNRNTKKNAKKVVDAQLALIDVLSKKQYPKYVQETLSKIFTREAVEGFQKEFGKLKEPNTLHDMKLFLDKLYEDIKLNPDVEEYSDECESSLIYGFGHYPAPVRVDLKNFGKDTAKASNAVWALVSMSLRYPVFSKNGKGFEIFDTGSQNDDNCAFRAIAVGAGLGPNGYNEIQQRVIDGAKKLLDELRNGSGHKTLDEGVLLENITNVSNLTRGCFVEYLEKYIKDRENGFVGGMTDIDRSLVAISLGRPICVIDAEEGSEYTFLPNGKKIDGIKDDTEGKPIYISIVRGHSTALLPLDKFDRDHKLPPNDSTLESEVEGAVKDSMITIMMKEIQKGKKSKLLKSMVKFSNFYVDYTDENKRTKNNEDLFLTMDMIGEIVDKMSADEVSKIEKIEQEITNLADSNDMDGIKSKLELTY